MAKVTRTLEECRNEALRYKTRTEFQRKNKAFYLYAFRRGWLDSICSHMGQQGSREYRYVYVIENETHIYVGITYNIAKRRRAHRANDKMVSIFGKDLELIKISCLLPKHEAAELERYVAESVTDKILVNKIKAGGLGGSVIKWTEEKLIGETLGYTRISHFRKDKPHVYAMFHRKGMLGKLRQLMTSNKTPNGTLTFERCKSVAAKYSTRSDFKYKSPKEYDAACRNKWLSEITSHMPARSCHKRNDLFDPIR